MSADDIVLQFDIIDVIGHIEMTSFDRGRNTTVYLSFELPDITMHQSNLRLDISLPQTISTYIKDQYPDTYADMFRYHYQLSEGLSPRAKLDILPTTSDVLKYRLELPANQNIGSKLFSRSNLKLAFSTILLTDIYPTIGCINTDLLLENTLIGHIQSKMPEMTPISIIKQTLAANYSSNILSFSMQLNTTLPQLFNFEVIMPAITALIFKDQGSASSCVFIDEKSNPAAKCHQKIMYYNGSEASSQYRIDYNTVSSVHIVVSNPTAGLSTGEYISSRYLNVAIHNLQIASDTIPNRFDVKFDLKKSEDSDLFSPFGQPVTMEVMTDCPSRCSMCSKLNPNECYECKPGVVLYDRQCILSLQRYHAYLSIRSAVNGISVILLALLGVHNCLAIRAGPNSSKYRLNYLTDSKMVTSLLVHLQTFMAILYAWLSGNNLMLFYCLATSATLMLANVAMIFYFNRQSGSKQVFN